MDTEPELIDVPVVGGTLRVARWGTARNVAIAAHGITGSSMGWLAVARRLDADWSIVAPDLRGRGESRDVPGPFGLEAHADDLIAIAGHLGVGRAVLAGHSMGAFVVAIAAAKAPALGERVVLVDGGLPLPLPGEGLDLDAVIEAILGPALARLRMT